MSERFRKILFIFFIGGFIVITPLVMLYAAGYEFSFEAGKIQKTGMLNIVTDPKGAKVYLNDKLQSETSFAGLIKKSNLVSTPVKIKNLLPGEYKVRLEADGYWTWEKKVYLNPGEAINLDQVILVRKDIPLMATSEPISGVVLSPDKSEYLCLEKNQCGVFSVSGENLYPLTDKVCSANNLAWSSDGSRLIIGEALYYLNGGSAQKQNDFPGAIPKAAKLFKFDLKDSSNLYYYNAKNIYRYSLNQAAIEPIVKTDAAPDDLLVSGNDLDYITRIGNKAFLIAYDLSAKKETRRIELPYSDGYQLKDYKNNLLTLLDSRRKILYLIDPAAFTPLKETIQSVNVAYWIDSTSLLYANDFEIWKIDAASGAKELFTRISTPIKDVIWHPSGDFIIFSTENSINLLETSGPEKKIIELVKLDQVSAPVLDENGEIIYFYGAIREKKGIYKLRIR